MKFYRRQLFSTVVITTLTFWCLVASDDATTSSLASTSVADSTLVPQSALAENIPAEDAAQLFQQKQGIVMSRFAEQFRIEKDASDPTRQLNIILPAPTTHHFALFAARVIDISPVSDVHIRDANRTFSASLTDSAIINIHGLNAGHQYSIEILGRRDHDTTLIKEESIVMDPAPLELAEIRVSERNITITATKPKRALQDAFRVEYIQRSPPKRFPILDVHDIEEQHHVELYLGNLSPGRDYDIVVTSLRGELRSQPWKGLMATKPLSPANLSITMMDEGRDPADSSTNNSTCLRLIWTLPPESGADSFKIVYGQVHSQNDTQKAETTRQEAELCTSIHAGRAYIFAVVAVKSMQASAPATISHVVRPLPARRVDVRADFERGKFRVGAILPPVALSASDHCQIIVVSERAERFEQTVAVSDPAADPPSCVTWLALVPGRRYEVSVAALSGGAFSTKTFVNKALEPGFDFAAFGLSIKESTDAPAVRVEWPYSEVSMLRIADLWAKIVGNESRLHLTLTSHRPDSGAANGGDDEDVQQMETAPNEAPRPLIADHLRMGACYRVGLYTVTSSGIVSEERFDESLRLRVPRLGVVVGSLTSRSARLDAIFLKSVPPLSAGTSEAFASDTLLPPSISADCTLKVIVLDAASQIVYSHALPLVGVTGDVALPPRIELTGLRPYFKYSVNAQTICGSARNESHSSTDATCAPKIETLDALLFETHQDRPGPIRNLSVRALGPQALEVSWAPPALRNGIITHYIINVIPMGPTRMADFTSAAKSATTPAASPNSISRFAPLSRADGIGDGAPDWERVVAGGGGGFAESLVERPWSVNMPAANTADFSPDGGESILPRGGVDAPPLIAVLEARGGAPLAGGRRYRVSAVGVTAAGVGDLPPLEEMPPIDTPITAPPRPSAADGFRVEVTPGSVRADRFSVTFSTGAFSAANGPITRMALVVTQLDGDGAENGAAVATTWAQAQTHDVWPPYLAVVYDAADAATVPSGGANSRRPLQITQAVGIEADCGLRADRQSDAVCNGALRPASRYRVRVRLYTAPDLWTDSEPSEVIETEALRGDVSVGGVLGALALICFACAFLASLFLAFFRRRTRKKQRAQRTGKSPGHEAAFFDCGACCYLSAEQAYDAHAADGAHRYVVNGGFDGSDASGVPPKKHPEARHFPQQPHSPQHIFLQQQKQQPQQQQARRGGRPAPRRQRVNWTVGWLKMIMAERAADCLAKLGLDSAAASTASYAASVSAAPTSTTASTQLYDASPSSASSPASGETSKSLGDGNGASSQPPLSPAVSGWLNNGRAHTLAGGQAFEHTTVASGSPAATSTMTAAPPPTGKTVTSTLSAPKHQLQPCDNGLFNAHHRRSKSLRERTGVDQRLERLPSGPPAHKLLLWTVVRAGGAASGNEKSRPVRICDFPEHVRLMSADSDFRFSEEYEELRHVGVGQTSIAADLTINRAKNRFTNILPYDHSRVKLRSSNDDEDDGSDYVNASYIPGFNSRREFIAAQGPLPSTRDHFWRMVWEQQCPAIVALTKCVEKGRDKCHQYWPDSSQRSVLYADIEVTLLNESIEYDEFTVRELRLTNLADPSQPARTVQHLHYMAWPDFGVPDHPAGIVHFSRLFRNKLPPSNTNKPTIVHCSAGVGRSGTFIALDRLVQNVELGRNLDVFGTVNEMRLERCHMVQNEQQYIFIHHCLLYVLENFFPHLIQRTPGFATVAGAAATPATPCGRNVFFGQAPSPSAAASAANSAAGCYRFAADTMQLNQLRSFAPPSANSGVGSGGLSSFGSPGAGATTLPKIEVHHNPAFVAGDEDEDDDDDEGISGSSVGEGASPPAAGTPLSGRAAPTSGQKHFNSDIFMM